MKKPEKLRLKLIFLAGFLGLLVLWYVWDLPCVLRSVTGIPCVTCGMTRAWLCLFRLDIRGAFLQHPMFWAVPLLVLYLMYDGKLFAKGNLDRWILILVPSAMILLWLARLFGFLGALTPL